MTKSDDKRVPALRFKGFTDEWEQHTLGDFGSVAMNKRIFKNQTTDKGDVPFFKISTFGKKADSFISNNLFEKYKEKYPYPQKGDLLISASGSIGRIVEYKGQKAYYQDSNIVWLNHNKELLNIYLKAYYQVIHWHGIEGSTIKRLYNKNILATSIFVPDKKEQYELGRLIKKAEKIISLQQRKLKLLKLLKQGMLQNLFTSKDTPILRFYGFYDILKQYKLSHLFYVNGRIGFRGYTRKDIISKNEGGIWAISPINIQDNCLVSLHNNTYITKAKYEESPEIQLRPSYSLLVKTGSTLGKSAYINNLYEPATINPQIAVLKPINKKISKYLGYILTTDNFLQQITALKIGGAIPTLTERDLKEVKLYIVPDTKEANKISNFLNKLDVIIGFQQKNINNLHQVKKFLFQNMFI